MNKRFDFVYQFNSRSVSAFCLSFFLFCLCHILSFGQTEQIKQERHQLSVVKDSISKVNSLNRLGLLYRAINTDSCFYYGMEAKRLAMVIGYEKGQAEADHLVAHTFYSRGLYAEALERYGEVLPLYEKQADTVNIIQLYLDKAEVLNKGIVEKNEVTALLQQAIQMGSQLANDSIMAYAYVSYCNRNGNLSVDSMMHYLNKTEEIANRYDDEGPLLYVRYWDAYFLIIKGQRKEALSRIEQLTADAQRIGNSAMEINACFLMADYYKDDYKKALEYYDRAYHIARENKSENIVNYILTEALTIAKASGNKDEIINLYTELEDVTADEWDRTKRFIKDYVQLNTMQQNNRLLMAKNEKRTLWLIVISSVAVVIVLMIYLIMLHHTRKAKQLIETLNNAANLQIIALEEAKHQAIKEEQQRLGQDLHDGLSASIAAVKHQLEAISMDIDDDALKDRLAFLQSEVTKAYETARNKSHEWFNATGEQEEQSFEERIKLLTENALPDSRYQKEILIDNHSLAHINADTRISLLRIIQEAMTNIIKHARAKHVRILIYEEVDHLLMMISDDGKGLSEKNLGDGKSTIGLQSIQRRVQYLNGNMRISSSTSGTELSVSIPLTSTSF